MNDVFFMKVNFNHEAATPNLKLQTLATANLKLKTPILKLQHKRATA